MNTNPPDGPFRQLVLRNVRCFREVAIDLDPALTILIGENGSVKTTLVEALASLSYGEDEGLPDFPLSRQAKAGEIALFGLTGSRPLARWRSRRGDRRRLPEDRYLLTYGRYRRVYFPEDGEVAQRRISPERDMDELARTVNARRTTTVFRPDNHLLRDLSRYLGALHYGRASDPRLDTIWYRLDESLKLLGYGIEGIEMTKGRHGRIPMIIRNGLPLQLRELSDGYQAILVVVFDLILRYAYLFPSLNDPLLGEASVAIDEVDLHLHPRWQRTVGRQLTSLFPNTQFILTTHSAAVVQEAIDQKQRVVTLHEENGATIASSLDTRTIKKLEGAEIGSVLLEQKLFGVDSRYSPKYSDVEERVAKTKRKIQRGTAIENEKAQLFQDLRTLQKLVVADEERRADGSFMSQMSDLRLAFLKELAAEIEKVQHDSA